MDPPSIEVDVLIMVPGDQCSRIKAELVQGVGKGAELTSSGLFIG
jgi:hypothetical protein